MKVWILLIVTGIVVGAPTISDENSVSSSEDISNPEENSNSSSDENSSSSSDESSSGESSECQLRYKYTIWLGDDVDEVRSINLKSKCGIFFLDAMRQASRREEQFAFKFSTHPLYGAFVTQIGDVANDDKE